MRKSCIQFDPSRSPCLLVYNMGNCQAQPSVGVVHPMHHRNVSLPRSSNSTHSSNTSDDEVCPTCCQQMPIRTKIQSSPHPIIVVTAPRDGAFPHSTGAGAMSEALLEPSLRQLCASPSPQSSQTPQSPSSPESEESPQPQHPIALYPEMCITLPGTVPVTTSHPLVSRLCLSNLSTQPVYDESPSNTPGGRRRRVMYRPLQIRSARLDSPGSSPIISALSSVSRRMVSSSQPSSKRSSLQNTALDNGMGVSARVNKRNTVHGPLLFTHAHLSSSVSCELQTTRSYQKHTQQFGSTTMLPLSSPLIVPTSLESPLT